MDESETSSETMIVLDHIPKAKSSFTLAWENVSLSVKDQKTGQEKRIISHMVIYNA